MLLFRCEWGYLVSLNAYASIWVRAGVFGEFTCRYFYFGTSWCIQSVQAHLFLFQCKLGVFGEFKCIYYYFGVPWLPKSTRHRRNVSGCTGTGENRLIITGIETYALKLTEYTHSYRNRSKHTQTDRIHPPLPILTGTYILLPKHTYYYRSVLIITKAYLSLLKLTQTYFLLCCCRIFVSTKRGKEYRRGDFPFCPLAINKLFN